MNAQKTAVVELDRLSYIPKYERYEKRRTRIKAHISPCIKVGIGNENMPDKEIIENFNSIYSGIVNALPKKKENIKKIMVKLTMTKPIKVEAE